MAVETRYIYQSHHHKHQVMGGEELLPTWQKYVDSCTWRKVSQVLNINCILRSLNELVFITAPSKYNVTLARTLIKQSIIKEA